MERPVETTVAESFMRIFSGLTRAHGTYDLSNPFVRPDNKKEGRAVTKPERVTLSTWENHLRGIGAGLGIVPIRDGNDCVFGAIDVDFYQGLDHKVLVNKLRSSNIPLVVCRSKSGGAHLFCFARSPVTASLMKKKLSEVASLIGYGGMEIFPKQEQLLSEQGDCGSWINMPYFNGTRGMRYAVDSEGNAMSPEAFIMAAESLAVDSDWFEKPLVVTSHEFVDGPPCLQALVQIGYPPGTRNDGLYNIGVYLKKSHPDTWESLLEEYNHKFMSPPLLGTEVQGLVKSLKKKDYRYGCTKQPIMQHCNSALCRTRKWGVGSGTSGKFPMLGGLTKLNTKPPIWFWTVDGTRIELSTAELQNPRAFQNRCMDYINMMPQVPSAAVWQAAVQHAMDSVTIIDAPMEASAEGQFWEMLEKFCTSRAQALSLDEIVTGKPYTEAGKTYFRLQDVLAFLNRNKFFEFKITKIASILRDSKAKHHFNNLKGRGVNYWAIDEFQRQTSGFEVPKEIKDREDAF